jgi:hypothetical protein
MRYIIFVLVLLSETSFSAPMKSASDAKAQCTHIADALGGSNYDRASEIIMERSEFPPEWGANFRYEARKSLGQGNTDFGTLLGAEFVRSEEVGKSLSVHYYFVKFARQPMVFQCVVYRATKEWKIVGVTFQTDISLIN